MKREFSAGGIVYRKQAGLEILVCQHSQHHGWVFPKGLIGDHISGEGKEETALRETKEETGIVGRIIEPLPEITYWFEMDKEKHKKTVYYYLMEFVEGDTTKHDWEMAKVEWLSIDSVEQRLTFASDKKVWEKAKKRIQELV